MIRQQIRRDPFFLPLDWGLLLGVLIACIVLQFGQMGPDSDDTIFQVISLMGLAGVCSTYLLRPELLKVRFEEFWFCLPISPRSLARARFALILAACGAPFLLVWIVVLLFWPGEVSRGMNACYLGVMGAMIFSIAVQDIRCHGKNVLRWTDSVPGFLALLVSMTAWFVVLDLWFSIGLLVVGILLAAWSWTTTPD